MKPWEAEVQLTTDQAAALIAGQFPELTPVDAVYFGRGWDNTAYLVNGVYVFRFPRRAFALPFFETELRVLGAIAPKLPLPIPDPILIGRPAGDYLWPFAGYRLIEGQTVCSANLTDAQRADNASILATFLRTLHSIPIDEAGRAGAGPDPIRRMDVGHRTNQLREDIGKILGTEMKPPSNWEAIVDAVQPPSDVKTLVHGDLYARHLLVDAKAKISGVIDWGDCHIGHPAIDLAIVHSFLPPEAHAAFLIAYGPVDESTWTLARWRALQHTSMLALFAHDTVDANLMRDCDTTFRYLERSSA